MSNAISKRPADVILADKKDAIVRALPSMISPDRFWQIVAAVVNSSDLSKCAPASIVKAVYGVAKLGLIPDPVLGHVFIVPRKGEAVVQMGYKGFIELTNRSRTIAAVHAEVVGANELPDFRVRLGTARSIEHIPYYMMGIEDPGEPAMGYCTWIDKRSGTTEFHTIDRKRIERAKKSSAGLNSEKGGFSPWKTDEAAMWKKTAIIDTSKLWSLSPELANAIAWDQQAEIGEPQTLPEPNGAGGRVVVTQKPLSLNDDPSEGTDAASSQQDTTMQDAATLEAEQHLAHKLGQDEPPQQWQDEIAASMPQESREPEELLPMTGGRKRV